MQQKGYLLGASGKALLHMAPDARMAAKLRELGKVDLTLCPALAPDCRKIQHDDNSFDLIYCSHVLEHMAYDSKIVREMFRVLKPGAAAIVQVPVDGKQTVEDPLVATPEGRAKRFGRPDQYRRYGSDFAFRLQAAGFCVSVVRAADVMAAAELARLGVPADGQLFYCEKRYEIRCPPTSRLVLSGIACTGMTRV